MEISLFLPVPAATLSPNELFICTCNRNHALPLSFFLTFLLVPAATLSCYNPNQSITMKGKEKNPSDLFICTCDGNEVKWNGMTSLLPTTSKCCCVKCALFI